MKYKVLSILLGVYSLFATTAIADEIVKEATAVATSAIKSVAVPDGQTKNPEKKSSSSSPKRYANLIIARSTKYHASERGSDRETVQGKTASLVPIKSALKKGFGLVAVDPEKIPYGSVIITPTKQIFVALYTGSAVRSRKAARELAAKKKIPQSNPLAKAPVLDFYSSTQIGANWDYFLVIRYEGSSFKALSLNEKEQYLEVLSKTIFGSHTKGLRRA